MFFLFPICFTLPLNADLCHSCKLDNVPNFFYIRLKVRGTFGTPVFGEVVKFVQ